MIIDEGCNNGGQGKLTDQSKNINEVNVSKGNHIALASDRNAESAF